MTKIDEAQAREDARQEAIDWLVLLRSDELSAEDANAFAEWLARDGGHVAAFAEAEQLFSEMTAAATQLARPAAPLREAPARLDPVPARSRQPWRRPAGRAGRWWALGLAVAAAWLLAIGLVPRQEWQLLDAYGADYHTGIGEVREIALADGSTAILDTHSAISVELEGPLRRISLRHGRVHVRVKADPARPFEVVGDQLVVRALGTAFDARQADGTTEVTVQEHAVSVRRRGDPAGTGTTVQEGQRLTYRNQGPLPAPEPVGLDQASAWQSHRLMVSDRPLEDLLGELERYRIGRILVADASLRSLRVTGVFSLDRPTRAVDALCAALDLRQSQLGPWVLLHR